jgi:hypothetical protein
MFKINIIRIVLILFLLYLNSIDANQTQLWESPLNELRGEFDYKLGVNAKIHDIYDERIEDLKSLISGKVFVK